MTPDSTNGSTRMLVIDDDSTFRDRLARALEARGHQARAAAGPDALAVAREFRPHRAVVDLRMPGLPGIEVIRQLVAIDPAMRIIVLTGYGSIPTAIEATRLGAIDYLTKPADTDQILSAFEPKDSPHPQPPIATAPSLARVEWEHIQRILTDCGGNISQTARTLGIHRRSLQRKLGKMPPVD